MSINDEVFSPLYLSPLCIYPLQVPLRSTKNDPLPPKCLNNPGQTQVSKMLVVSLRGSSIV